MSEPGPADLPPWRHVHPLTPLLRGGFAVIAFGSYALSRQVEGLLGQGDGPSLPLGNIRLAIVVLVAALGLVIAYSWVAWRFTRFRMTPVLVETRTGVLFRQHRQVRYDRIQSVDIARPVLARLVGVSEVVVQSAGGGGGHLRLAYLGKADAEAVRDALAARTAQVATPGPDGVGGSQGGGGTAVEEGASRGGLPPRPANTAYDPFWRDDVAAAPGRQPVRVSWVQIVLATLCSAASVALLASVAIAVAALAAGRPALAAGVVPVMLGSGPWVVRRLLDELDFVLTPTPGALVVRHGLTETRSVTVPYERIQAVELRQPLLWRPFGWWRIEVNVAGSGHGEDAQQDATLLPVGLLTTAVAVLDMATERPSDDLVRAATTGSGSDGGFATAGARARWLDPLGWRRIGYAARPATLVIRSGAFHRRVAFVPHARIQSLALRQGPLQKALGLATVAVATTHGPVHPVVPHLDLPAAEALLDSESALATRSRRVPSPLERGVSGPDQPGGPVGGPPLSTQRADGLADPAPSWIDW